MIRDVASPQPTPASRVGLRTHRHSVVAFRSGPCTTSLPRPGRPRRVRLPRPPGRLTTSISDRPRAVRPRRAEPDGPIGINVRWTVSPRWLPVGLQSRESPHLVLGGSSDGARQSRSLPGVGRVADRNPGRDHPRLPHPATRPSPRHTPCTVPANRRRTPTASCWPPTPCSVTPLAAPTTTAQPPAPPNHRQSPQGPTPADRPSGRPRPDPHHPPRHQHDRSPCSEPPLRAGPVRRHR